MLFTFFFTVREAGVKIVNNMHIGCCADAAHAIY